MSLILGFFRVTRNLWVALKLASIQSEIRKVRMTAMVMEHTLRAPSVGRR